MVLTDEQKEYNKKYYENNKERLKHNRKEYYKNNKAQLIERQQKYNKTYQLKKRSGSNLYTNNDINKITNNTVSF